MNNKKIYFKTAILRYIFEDKNTQDERKKIKTNTGKIPSPARPECSTKRSVVECIEGCIIILTLFLSQFLSHAQSTQVISFISPRSQGFDTPRVISGWDTITHCPTKENFYSTYGFAVEPTSSFRPERINQCLFGQDIVRKDGDDTEWKDFIIVSGSQTENRSPNKDWLADYFGLPTDFSSVVRFRPRVNNVIVEAQTFWGCNNVAKGLYAEIFLPLVYTNCNLDIGEAIIDAGTNSYAPGYFNPNGVKRSDLLNCFSSYIAGYSVPNMSDLTFQPLTHGKMALCTRHAVHFAELRTNLGYDWFIHDRHHIGLKIQGAIPLGTRPHSEFLFEPIVGNGHHYELGGGITAHAAVWENVITEEKVDLFLDVTVNHMFTTKQRRSFDLFGKPNSRYMLAEKMTSDISDNLKGGEQTPIAQFNREVSSIVNFTTRDITVSINAQADVALSLSYTYKRNYWTIGYNAWKRGCENITLQCCDSFPNNVWAIKGDAQVYGFVAASDISGLPVGTAVPLSATESQATINYGTNLPKEGVSSDPVEQAQHIQTAQRNPNIDFPEPAFAGNNQYLVASLQDTSLMNQINTSIQPVLITITDLDLNSAATSGFSNKLFTHFDHHIRTYGRAESHIGLGAEIEFGRQAGLPPEIGEDKCLNCALSVWGVWLKGSVCW
jgi:hypothetical protein